MELPFLLVMVGIGIIGSFFSGLLGIGGAIINFPLLLFVPPWLGVGELTAQEVSSISMFQVLFAALSGMVAYHKRSNGAPSLIHRGLVRHMGLPVMMGSFIGAWGSGYLSDPTINMVYGFLALIAVVMMVIPLKGEVDSELRTLNYPRGLAVSLALIVGVFAGIIGAGGGFILIPIMLVVLKIPTRVAIASSIAIMFISALGGVVGKLMITNVPIVLTLFAILGSVIGAPLGSRVSTRINVRYLRYGLAIVLFFTALKVWSTIL